MGFDSYLVKLGRGNKQINAMQFIVAQILKINWYGKLGDSTETTLYGNTHHGISCRSTGWL